VPDTSHTPPTIGLVALVLIVGWCAVIAYAVHPVLPFNAIRLPGESAVDVELLLPEGWGFFSRNPQEEVEHFLKRTSGGSWQPLLPDSYASPRFALGLSRRGRASTQEARWLIQRLPASSWSKCTEAPTLCLEHAPRITIKSAQPQQALCGEVGIVLQKPVPWAWARHQKDVCMPSRVARLWIAC
jgi:antimicrobial peptide system SdpA family protein